MTLQEAKDEVAKKYRYDSWDKIDWANLDWMYDRTQHPFMEQKLSDEAAELYARAKWDEACQAQRQNCESVLTLQANQNKVFNAPKPEFKP